MRDLVFTGKEESQLEVSELSVHYGEHRAVDRVSFSVGRGERVCLLGPSGCGKTTTLQAIAGFVVPTSGGIRIWQRDVSREPPERRNIGVMFQNYALFPHLSVHENVAFGLRMRNRPDAEIRERVERALALVRLTHKAGSRPRLLSGGEQQRVAFARSIVIEPSLLLLDEPFSNLDARLRQEMRGEFLDLLDALGTSTVMVTHDQEEAMAIADRIVLMRDGRVEQTGVPAEVYASPTTLFVAQFLGVSNVLAGRVVRMAGGGAKVEIAGLGELVGRAPGGVSSGSAVHVVLRPHLAAFPPAQDAADGWNLLSAEVERIVFLGHRAEVTLRVGEHRLLAWRDTASARNRIGETVAVCWRHADTLFLAGER